MSITTCIYINDPQLKKDATILAKIQGKSFSSLVWDQMAKMVEQNREAIEKMKQLQVTH